MKKECVVSIIMGSKNDFSLMKKAVDVLNEFGIGCEARALSAHRTPELVFEYAKGLKSRGVRVVIAAAGMAAHLPGVISGLTPLPVIGVSIESKGIGGLDALLAIAQMPPGVPVATVAVNGAKNAAILAVRILALSDSKIEAAFEKYLQVMKDEVVTGDKQVRAEM